jgi:hypothetical protein
MKGLPLQRERTGENDGMGGAKSAAAPSGNILPNHFPDVATLAG